MAASENQFIPVDVGGVDLRIDVKATHKAYEDLTEECTCPQCRNFMAQIQEAISPALVTELMLVGINPYKPTEILHICPVQTGHSYGVNYHFVGVWSESAQLKLEPSQGQMQRVPIQVAGIGGHVYENEMPAPDVFARPYMNLELNLTAQWVIDDPEPK